MALFGLGGESTTRARALTALPLQRFTGGLNLSSDLGTILDDEVTEACNVDFERSGVFCRRKPFKAFGQELPAPVCSMSFAENFDPFLPPEDQPRSIVWSTLENGEVWAHVYQPNGDIVTTGPFPGIESGEQCQRNLQVNFLQYFYSADECATCVDGLTPTQLPWVTSPDYIEPDVANGVVGSVGVQGFPKASYMTIHGGNAWAAGVVDPVTGEYECNRIWRSYPLPDGGEQFWGENSWIDIDPGLDGDCITGIVSCGGNLYVFKSHSIYRIDGIDGSAGGDLRATQICGDIGAVNCDAIVCCDCRIWFWDARSGLNVLTDEGITPAFTKLSSLLDDERIDCGQPQLPRVGCCGDKILVSVPTAGSDENDVTYVFDQTATTWTKYDVGLRYIYDVCPTNFKGTTLAATNECNHLVEVCKTTDDCFDDFGCTKKAIHTRVATPWYDNGNPWSTKQWCRPELVVQCSDKPDQFLRVEAQVDYQPEKVVGSIEVDISNPRDGLERFRLNESTLAVQRYDRLVPGGELVLSGCKTGDVLKPIPDNSVKKKVCGPPVDCNACTMRLVFEGPAGDWCVCGILLLYREEPITC